MIGKLPRADEPESLPSPLPFRRRHPEPTLPGTRPLRRVDSAQDARALRAADRGQVARQAEQRLPRQPRESHGLDGVGRSEEHTSELQSLMAHIVCRLLLEKKKRPTKRENKK